MKVALDLGSNIGISALYFLTRNSNSKCYLFEPDERNVRKLKQNLINYKERYKLFVKAVSNESGFLEFGIEEFGRYGGIGVKTDRIIKVECVDINSVIKEILKNDSYIDCIKIDTEGVELDTVLSIERQYLDRIKYIHLEAEPNFKIFPENFVQLQYGTVCQLKNRNIK